jgi:hypothetical protein
MQARQLKDACVVAVHMPEAKFSPQSRLPESLLQAEAVQAGIDCTEGQRV